MPSLPPSLRIASGSDEELKERRQMVRKMEARHRSQEKPKTRNSGKDGTKGQAAKYAKKWWNEKFRIMPKGMATREMSNVNAQRQYERAGR